MAAYSHWGSGTFRCVYCRREFGSVEAMKRHEAEECTVKAIRIAEWEKEIARAKRRAPKGVPVERRRWPRG